MTSLTPEVEAEIDAILSPIKAAHPGISNGQIVNHLPEHLRQPFWERAVGRYLEAELAKVEPEGEATR
ncbi:hypothetical protein QQG74_09175 [Micromonospora sp. FIMYZ51]|uniref:hypothetical protein n=1 Tax=Micromonospora sp. FIMYZ51 TaxID=3051832 RepID=UPI00311F280E